MERPFGRIKVKARPRQEENKSLFSRKTKTASQKSTKVFYSLKSLHPIILPVAIDLLAGLFFCFLASAFPLAFGSNNTNNNNHRFDVLFHPELNVMG